MTQFNQPHGRLPGTPAGGVAGKIAAAVGVVVAVLLGVFFFALFAALILVFATVLAIRLWWARRKPASAGGSAQAPPASGEVIDGEYRVVDKERQRP